MALPRLIFLAFLLPALAGSLPALEPEKTADTDVSPGPKVSDSSGAHSVKDLIAEMGSDSPTVRAAARRALFAMGRAAIEPLESAMLSDDAEIRLSAASLLMSLRGRGFLGVELEEDEESVVSNEQRRPAAPLVNAKNVVSYLLYQTSGVNKPFPAEKAGMEKDDKIIAINGEPIYSTKGLMRAVSLIGPGRVAILSIERNGKPIKLAAVLTRNPGLNARAYGLPAEPAPPVDLEKELPSTKNNENVAQPGH